MKKLALLLAAVLAIGGVSGCKKQKTAKEGDVPTLVWYVPGDKHKDMQTVMDAANEIVEKEIGARIDLQMLDTGAYAEKMQMMMAAQEEFDLMFTGYINTFDSCVSRGGLMDITDIIAEYAPQLIDDMPEYAKSSAYHDGKVYAMPYLQVVATKNSISVRHDLVEEFGLDLDTIKSPTDLEPFYDWVLKEHPEVFPMRAINMGRALPSNCFRIQDNYVIKIDDLTDGDDSVTIIDEYAFDETYRNAKQLWDWYQKGYIRKDVMTTSNDNADYSTGKYATFYTNWKPGAEADIENSLGVKYDVIKTDIPVVATSSRGTMIGVSSTSKHPVEAVKFINLINTNKELYHIICMGVKGKHYELDSEGKAGVIPDGGYNQDNGDWKFGNSFNALVKTGQDSNVIEETKQLNEGALTHPLLGFSFDNSKVSAEFAAVETILSQYNVRLYGAQDPDEYWNEMQQKLEIAGQSKIVEEYQRQVDEYIANIKQQ